MTSHSPSCPFCNISTSYPAVPPSRFLPQQDGKAESTAALSPSPDPTQPQAFLVLSTKSVMAFLDIMPLTKGHVLVVPRDHYEKLGDMGVRASREVGQWLPIISRVVMRTLFGEDADEDWHWNVVQNNGVRAAQQVPHVHFHIIPRPPLNTPPNPAKASWVMFGRGQRDELDDEEGDALAGLLRAELAKEVRRVKEVEGVDLEADWEVEGRKGKL